MIPGREAARGVAMDRRTGAILWIVALAVLGYLGARTLDCALSPRCRIALCSGRPCLLRDDASAKDRLTPVPERNR